MRKIVRTSVVAAGAVAALTLTGCGGGDSGDSAKDKGAGTSAPGGPDAGGGESAPADEASADSLEGTWAGTTEGKAVALSVKEGKAALIADEHICQGDVEEMGGEPMLSLKCADGNTERTMGSIDSNDGKTLVLSWEGGAKDSLAKTEPGKLPGGLPTDIPAP
ncbi:hypothetical protein SSPS47_19455 [Streptomyces sp. S4.7]|uniref:hypothetical protein n=1 Tax=Streptomyces sp. S4.7 TaxID=2705439 RepID=UPI0013985B46|nr:hypothetical protein [Streptomyces sp. S4.7]QHY97288.1 hypothetical protein SSPS47_19455 [Streptomyces sp. S4.7]